MSSKGIYTALSGAVAQAQRMDTIANNIANVNTTGFKKDQQVFSEYLSSYEKEGQVIQVPRVPASVESFYDMQGGDKSFVDTAGTYTDFSQGSLKQTDNPFDVALQGNGFLEVLTPQGVRLTRNGALKVDGQGRLSTKDGHPVLFSGLGQPGEGRVIQVDNRPLIISQNGEIYNGDQRLGQLSIVETTRPDQLTKIGGSLFQLKSNEEGLLQLANQTTISQGFLESSNTNIISEMTDMIEASRVFESTQQAIKAFDQMDGKLVNEVGKA